MSRFSSWLLTVLMIAFTASGASACPGSLAIGLPLLFGSDEPSSPWPTANDLRPILDMKLPSGLDEAQEFGEPLGRKGLAQECLKVWRELVREGRFDLAPVVAAKAAALDPTNLDAQHAVIVSQMLRSIGEKPRQEAKTVAATKATKTAAAPVCTAAGCEAEVCPACPGQCPSNCPAEVNSARPAHAFQFRISIPFCNAPCLPGSDFAIKYLMNAATPKNDVPAAAKAECPRAEQCPTATPTGDKKIVDRALNHLFLGGLLASDDANPARKCPVDDLAASKETKERLDRVYKALELEINRIFPDSVVLLRLVGDKIVVAGEAHDSIEATQIIRLIRANTPGADRNPNMQDPGITPIVQPRDPVVYGVPGESHDIPHSTVQIINMLRVSSKDLKPTPLTASSCDSATSQCGSLIFGAGVNTDAGMHGHIRTVGHVVPAAANKRVTIKTVAWQVECDRVVLMNEREMIVDGNVSLTMRQRDVSVQGSRVRVNLTDGSIQVDGK